MADRSRRGGRPVHQSYLGKIGGGGAKAMPKTAQTFEGLAIILGVPVRTVVLAFVSDLYDLDVGASHFADLIPPGVDDLPAEVLDSVNHLLRSLVGSTAPAPAHDPFVARSVTQDEIKSGRVRPHRHGSTTRSNTDGKKATGQ